MTDWPGIVAAHGPTVWRTVYRLLGDHADAADCYQETFLAAFRSAPAGVREWAAFLTTTATRRAIDRLRRRTRERSRTTGLDAPLPADGPGPADAVDAAELLAAVPDRLADLPGRQAEAFWLSAVEGLPHDQLAAHFGITPGAVRVLLHRARTALAAALTPDWSRP